MKQLTFVLLVTCIAGFLYADGATVVYSARAFIEKEGKRFCALHPQTELRWKIGFTHPEEMIVDPGPATGYTILEYGKECPNRLTYLLVEKTERTIRMQFREAEAEFCPICDEIYERYVDEYFEKNYKSKRPNKASDPTAISPPPSATPPAPLADLNR